MVRICYKCMSNEKNTNKQKTAGIIFKKWNICTDRRHL